MKKAHMFKFPILLISIAFLIAMVSWSACVSEKVSEKQPVDFVNPFIGTQASSERASTDGRTHPGACVPFGMTKWIPANIDNQSDMYPAFPWRHGPGAGKDSQSSRRLIQE